MIYYAADETSIDRRNIMKRFNAYVWIALCAILLCEGCIVVPIWIKHAKDWEVVAARADEKGRIVEQFVRREDGIVFLALGLVCEPYTVEDINHLDRITADSINSLSMFCGFSWKDHFIPIPNTDTWFIYRFGDSYYTMGGDMTVRLYAWGKGTIAKHTIKDVSACRLRTDYSFAILETPTGDFSMSLATGEISRLNSGWNQSETIEVHKFWKEQMTLCKEPILRKYR